MSTRAVIARVNGDGWKGIYHHSDGYPSGLGRELWAWAQAYRGNLGEMLADVVDSHPGGWSSLGHRCYCHDPQQDDGHDMIITGCECGHTPQKSGASLGEPEPSCGPLSIEYVYVIHPDSGTMTVLASYGVDQLGTKGYIMNGHQRPQRWYRHRLLAAIDLLGDEPDWAGLEQIQDSWYPDPELA